ncbi:MAG: queuosine precursor transporter [Pseudomonadota bacterium]
MQKNKYLLLITSLYITALLATVPLAYKIVSIGPFTLFGSIIVFPLIYIFGDVTTEIYGYKIARQLIWIALFCDTLFSCILTFGIHLPSPPSFQYQMAYNYILGHSIQLVLGGVLGIFVGQFLNIYILSKWKIFLKGRCFWLRSFCSSAIGETITMAIGMGVGRLGIISAHDYLYALGSTLLVQYIYLSISVWPAQLIVFILKNTENVTINDAKTSFNPFKFSA